MACGAARAQTLSIGGYAIGSSPIDLDLHDFIIVRKTDKIEASFNNRSVSWVKNDKNQLLPFVLLSIAVKDKKSEIFFKYKGMIIYPVDKLEGKVTDLRVNLFSPEKIEVHERNKLIDTIIIQTIPLKKADKKHYIDYTCWPYQFELAGVSTEYVSVGCQMDRVGQFGQEKPKLEVTLSSTNLLSAGNDSSPYTFYFHETATVDLSLINSNSQKNENIKLGVKLPTNLHRVKLAAGLGPYVYSNRSFNIEHQNKTALSGMLYGKFELNEHSSFKAFEAVIYDEATFNNSGLYFSYDIARILDGQVIFGALLGFQGLLYRFDKNSKDEFELIYPQGFELTYQHPFGLKNKYISYGMFLSSNQQIYRNIWLRYGDSVFYEINYIKWAKDADSNFEMWGVSIGFPLWRGF